MRIKKVFSTIASAVLATQLLCVHLLAQTTPGNGANVAIAPQYDTAHVYVAPEDFDRFVQSLIETFGGTTTKQGVFTVTPTESSTMSQLVLTPVGSVSVFGFKTPIPYPFGLERTGYLVTDMDEAVRAAKATGADVFVAPFNDPIGRAAIIQWPGGVNTQLYWHTTAPSYIPLQTGPENRVYVSPDRVDAFGRSFLAFSHGRDRTGYAVVKLAEPLAKAKAAGVDVLVPPYKTEERDAVVVRFPGGYIAEIHSARNK